MSKINAKIVADSLSIHGDRLTTLLITFPRFILAEVNTHRMLSKNTSSSRAIPFEKMIQSVEKDPFIPIAWQKEILYLCRKIKSCISTKQQTYLMVKFI
jgi:hypothetical protein